MNEPMRKSQETLKPWEPRKVFEVLTECQRADSYGHERCPGTLDSAHPSEPYKVICTCPCHKHVEELVDVRGLGQG